jgi:YD repeat-containing protein
MVASVGSLYNSHITLSYDEAGRVVNRTYHTVGDGLQTDFTYYDWDEMVNTVPQGGLLETSQTGTLADPDSLVSLAYVYDAVGNVMSITDLVQSPAQTQTFTYDALNRLTSAAASAGFGGAYSEEYTYDDKGRMDSKDGATMYYWAQRTGTCQAKSLTPYASNYIKHAVQGQSGGYSYTYDSLSGVRPHQAYARVQENPVCNGNAITRGDQVLLYDEENRLVEVQVNSVTVAEYVYDGDATERHRAASVVCKGS